jgi:hypothetical protein
MQHFAVVAMPRSGSTRLCEILGRHPAIACQQEIFHPHEVQAFLPRDRGLEVMDRDRRDADPASFLDRFLDFAQEWFAGRTWHGFKVLLNDRQVGAATQIVCPSARLSKIVLRRDNLFACYTSLRLAIETGVWQRSGDALPANRQHHLVLDRARFLAFAGQELAAHAAILESMRRNAHRFLELEYRETLTPAGLEPVWRFLGLPPIDAPGLLNKVNTRPLLECYADPDEVRQTMRDLGRTEWLVGDDAPVANT